MKNTRDDHSAERDDKAHNIADNDRSETAQTTGENIARLGSHGTTSAMMRDATRLRTALAGTDGTAIEVAAPIEQARTEPTAVQNDDIESTAIDHAAAAYTPRSKTTITMPASAKQTSTTERSEIGTLNTSQQARPREHQAPLKAQAISGDAPFHSDKPTDIETHHATSRSTEQAPNPIGTVETGSVHTQSLAGHIGNRRRLSGVAAIAAAILTGTGVAVALYVGGGDYLTEIFSNDIESTPSRHPAEVTDRYASIPEIATTRTETLTEPAPRLEQAQGEIPQSDTSAPKSKPNTAPLSTNPHHPNVRRATVATPQPTNEHNGIGAESHTNTSRLRGVSNERGTERNTEARNERRIVSTTTKPTPTNAAKYAVQIGATPDEGEANRLASQLKQRGVSGVMIIKSEKQGQKIYRIRYGSFETRSKAESDAERNGYQDVWVIGK